MADFLNAKIFDVKKSRSKNGLASSVESVAKDRLVDVVGDRRPSIPAASPEVEVFWLESCSLVQSPRSIAQEAFGQRRGVTGGRGEGRSGGTNLMHTRQAFIF